MTEDTTKQMRSSTLGGRCRSHMATWLRRTIKQLPPGCDQGVDMPGYCPAKRRFQMSAHCVSSLAPTPASSLGGLKAPTIDIMDALACLVLLTCAERIRHLCGGPVLGSAGRMGKGVGVRRRKRNLEAALESNLYKAQFAKALPFARVRADAVADVQREMNHVPRSQRKLVEMMAVAERVRKEARAKKGGGVLTGTNDSTADKVAAIASEGEGGRGRGAGEASTSGKGGADLRSRLDERDGTDAKEKVALDPERMSKAERLAAGLTRRKLKAKEFRKKKKEKERAKKAVTAAEARLDEEPFKPERVAVGEVADRPLQFSLKRRHWREGGQGAPDAGDKGRLGRIMERQLSAGRDRLARKDQGRGPSEAGAAELRDSVIQAYRSKRLSRLAKLGHSTEHLSVRGATPATLKDLVGRTGKGGADGGE